MKIWLINHYAVPPKYYPLARPSLFAKNLGKMGHEVTIIAASTVHNSDENLINNGDSVKSIIDDGTPYILINCHNYHGNGINRVLNILDFARKLPKILNKLEKPDVIVATCFDPFSCYAGIRYAKKHGIKAIAEIADLWPETLLSYSRISRHNPIIHVLRRLEKKIYMKADRIVFTMEGAYDYIIEQRWEREIPRCKVAYINNGVDLEKFDKDKELYRIEDEDLDNANTFKVVYVGSIRRVNGLGTLLDIAKRIQDQRIVFLIWGDGDEREQLTQRVEKEGIRNVIFKGRVEKQFIPYITSKADLNIAHNNASEMFRFGLSFNKIFDYLAAGKPILCDFKSSYNPVISLNAGIQVVNPSEENVAEAIQSIADRRIPNYEGMCRNARKAAEIYDFKKLTNQLIEIIEQI